MTPVYDAAIELQAFFKQRNWPFAIIGGLAVIAYGEPRTTQDVDACLLTGFGGEDAFVAEIMQQFRPRPDTRFEQAKQHRVLLLQASNGAAIDVSLGALPYEEKAVQRAKMVRYSKDVRLRVVTAEDLVVLKAFAEREKDWFDVRGVLIRQRGKLDWNYIIAELSVLAAMKDSPDIVTQLEAMRISCNA